MKRIIHILLILVFSSSANSIKSSNFEDLHISLDDLMLTSVYDFIERMLLRYPVFPFHQNMRPYTYNQIQYLLKFFKEQKISFLEERQIESYSKYIIQNRSIVSYRSKESEFRLNLESGLHFTSRYQKNEGKGNEFAWQIRPIVTGQLMRGLSFSTDLRFFFITGQNFPNTIRTEIEVEQINEKAFDTAGLVPSYIQFNLPGFDLLIGKQNLSWGPGRYGNLLLSAHSIPMEMIYLRGVYNKVAFQAFQAIGQSSFGNKILSGHRIDLHLFSKLSLGISEIIVIGAEKFDPRFLNPVSIYTISEASGGGIFSSSVKTSHGNLLISGDIDFKIFDKTRAYIEVMIDDFQPRYRLKSHLHWGSKWGILAGLQMVDPFLLDNTTFCIEYTFLNQYSYTHKTPVNVYTHLGRPIGHHIGPDAQSIWTEICHQWTAFFTTKLGLELQHQGEQEINTPRDRSRSADENWYYLSGVEEIQRHLNLTGRFSNYGLFFLEATYTLKHIENARHISHLRNNEHELRLISLYRF